MEMIFTPLNPPALHCHFGELTFGTGSSPPTSASSEAWKTTAWFTQYEHALRICLPAEVTMPNQRHKHNLQLIKPTSLKWTLSNFVEFALFQILHKYLYFYYSISPHLRDSNA